MTEQELREKIVDVLADEYVTDVYGCEINISGKDAERIADALIAANIGDVSEWKSRAEVAEKQVYCLARMFAEALCKNGNTENLIRGFIKDAKKQAEKKLQEERKDDKNRKHL